MAACQSQLLLRAHLAPLFFLWGESIVKKSMKQGVEAWVFAALDTKDELTMQMIKAGVLPEQAILASTVVVKKEVREALERHYGDQSASTITSGLKTERGVGTLLN